MSEKVTTQEVGVSEQYGARRIDLEFEGWRGFVILPEGDRREREWVWYAPSFIGGHTPPAGPPADPARRLPSDLHTWIMTRCLAAGMAVAGVDVGESAGSPDGRRGFTAFHEALVKGYGLSFGACLLAQSRGGLMHYNWAVEHPEFVRRIVGIYPVCDLSGWPRVEQAAPAYRMTPEELQAALPRHSPVLRLAPLAAVKVPILHLHGDHDSVVPLDLHSGELVRRYRELGGSIELVVIPGAEHEEIPAFFESPRVPEFLIGGK
jgi:hypothetical protein